MNLRKSQRNRFTCFFRWRSDGTGKQTTPLSIHRVLASPISPAPLEVFTSPPDRAMVAATVSLTGNLFFGFTRNAINTGKMHSQ
jgi:hypothetical protein